MQFLGITDRSTLWRYLKEGKIPEPRYLSPGKPIWRLGEVLDHTHALMKTYKEEPRGFKGDERMTKAKTNQGIAEIIRQRLYKTKR